MSAAWDIIAIMPPNPPAPSVGAVGVVEDLTGHRNSRGDSWITFILRGPAATVECVCFPNDLARIEHPLCEDEQIQILGQWSDAPRPQVRVLSAEPVAPKVGN